jgi:hypothetical protein
MPPPCIRRGALPAGSTTMTQAGKTPQQPSTAPDDDSALVATPPQPPDGETPDTWRPRPKMPGFGVWKAPQVWSTLAWVETPRPTAKKQSCRNTSHPASPGLKSRIDIDRRRIYHTRKPDPEARPQSAGRGIVVEPRETSSASTARAVVHLNCPTCCAEHLDSTVKLEQQRKMYELEIGRLRRRVAHLEQSAAAQADKYHNAEQVSDLHLDSTVMACWLTGGARWVTCSKSCFARSRFASRSSWRSKSR